MITQGPPRVLHRIASELKYILIALFVTALFEPSLIIIGAIANLTALVLRYALFEMPTAAQWGLFLLCAFVVWRMIRSDVRD